MKIRTAMSLTAFAISLLVLWAPAFGGELEKFILNKNYNENLPPEDDWLRGPRTEVYFADGTTAENCEEYLLKRKSVLRNDSKMNLIIDCEYKDCIYYELLQKAKPHNGYRPKSHTEELMKRLDLRSFYNQPSGSLDSPDKHTLNDLNDPNIQLLNESEIFRPVGDLAETRFHIFADADLNGNGEPDWVFGTTEHALDVNFLYCNVFVIYDVKPTGMLKAVGYPFDQSK